MLGIVGALVAGVDEGLLIFRIHHGHGALGLQETCSVGACSRTG